jgi:hypothetical protein
MLKAPEEGEPQKKVVDGKEYSWCPKHNSYGRHDPTECKGQGLPDKTKSTGARETKFANAMSSYLEGDEKDEQDEE